jgi:hypothetical protein
MGKGHVPHDLMANGINSESVLALKWSSLGNLIMQAKSKGFG